MNTRVVDRSESQVEPDKALAHPASNGALVPVAAPSMESIIQAAVTNNTSPESLDKLLAVYERMSAIKAEQAFNAAFAAFRSECPPVQRKTANAFFKKVNRAGVMGPTMYASIEDIAATVDPWLGKHGLSYRWGNATIDNGILTIPFEVSHIGGHSKSSSGSMPLENNAGCSPQQKYGIAETYAMRRSMARGLGIATCDEDTDGNEPTATAGPKISDHQIADLNVLIDEVKKEDKPGAFKARFCKHMGIADLSDLPVSRLKEAAQELESKRGGK